jgi:type II secretory ATPase GspE/PulE/Tfp pilus assembly ATPase PilB-like protein
LYYKPFLALFHADRPQKPDLSPGARIEEELKRGEHISIIALVDGLIAHAQELRASDIHISPRHESVQVRLRVDGVLQDSYPFPKNIHQEVISRIKVLAGCALTNTLPHKMDAFAL